MAGKWKAWVLSPNNQFRPAAAAGLQHAGVHGRGPGVIDVKNNLTEEQKRIAMFWEGAEGTPLPAGIMLGPRPWTT